MTTSVSFPQGENISTACSFVKPVTKPALQRMMNRVGVFESCRLIIPSLAIEIKHLVIFFHIFLSLIFDIFSHEHHKTNVIFERQSSRRFIVHLSTASRKQRLIFDKTIS